MSITMPERLDHARAALTAYFASKGERLPEGPWDYEDTDVSDLIADLLHLQKRLGMRDARQTLQTAVMHYEAEESEPDACHYPCALCDDVDEPTCNSRCQGDRIMDPTEIGPTTGGAHERKIITIRVEGGVVQEVSGIPAGFELHVEDYDDGDTEHPLWSAEKGCFISVYEGETA